VFQFLSAASTNARGITQASNLQSNDFNGDHYIQVVRNSSNNQFSSYAGSGFRSSVSATLGEYYIARARHTGSSLTFKLNLSEGSSFAHTLNFNFSIFRIGSFIPANALPASSFINSPVAEVIIYRKALCRIRSGNKLPKLKVGCVLKCPPPRPMSILIKPAYDADASAYFTTAGVTNTAGRQQISRFVTGIKDLGLWSSMVCWPLRSSQNAGTGTTAYSLGGLATYNGTLLNSPTRVEDGIQSDVNNKTISHNGGRDFGTDSFTFGACLKVQTFALLTPFMGLYPPSATLAAYDANVSSSGILDVLIRNNSTAGGNSRVTAGAFTADTFGFATATRNNNVLSTFLNSSSAGTSSSLASGVNFTRTDTQSFITSRQNDSATHGLSTVAFAFLIKGQAISPSSLYTLYKTTLGQGLGLP
jgi:hypothetical protein